MLCVFGRKYILCSLYMFGLLFCSGVMFVLFIMWLFSFIMK